MIGRKVIVRGDRSGVFFGTLAERRGREVKLTRDAYGGATIVKLIE